MHEAIEIWIQEDSRSGNLDIKFHWLPYKNGHIHFDLRKMYIHVHVTLVGMMNKSNHEFHIINLPILFCMCQFSIHCFILELQYNDALTL